jgi:hypothetical protein
LLTCGDLAGLAGTQISRARFDVGVQMTEQTGNIQDQGDLPAPENG